MKGLLRRTRALCLLVTATLLGAMLTVFGPAKVAQADPGCQSAGAYILWVRGSGQGFDDAEARAFYENVYVNLRIRGITNIGWAELGNLDGQPGVDAYGYPAVRVDDWLNPAVINGDYSRSVETGMKELVLHLNRRYGSTTGPWVSGCTNETLVLGGYSQGADVVGWTLRRSDLSQAAKDHIGYAALYGDPKFDPGPLSDRMNRTNFQSNWWWVRGNDRGYRFKNTEPGYKPNSGILGARSPYVPEEFKGRFGSWCANWDGMCSGRFPEGQADHSNAYEGADGWIADGAEKEMGWVVANKRNSLNPGVLPATTGNYAPPDPSTGPPVAPPPPVIHQIKRTRDPDNTNQLYAATNSAVTEGWWKPGGDGVHTKEVIHIAQDNIVGFDKTNLPAGKQAVYTAVPDGVWETWWDPQHDPQSAKIITDLTGVRQVIADNRWEGTNHDQYVHRLYVLADQGPYEFWWKDGEKDASGNTIIHKNLLDSITGGVNMTSSTAPDGSYELYVATPTWSYELKWNPGQDFHHRPMINITQGDINSLSKVTVGSEERLFTGTSTGTWQGKWVGDGSPANNPEVNGKVGVISSQGMHTGDAFQIYLLTASGVTEFWYTPSNAGNGPVMSRAQGDLTSFTKFNDGAVNQVYTGTVNGEVLETYWGGGASLTTKPLFTVNR